MINNHSNVRIIAGQSILKQKICIKELKQFLKNTKVLRDKTLFCLNGPVMSIFGRETMRGYYIQIHRTFLFLFRNQFWRDEWWEWDKPCAIIIDCVKQIKWWRLMREMDLNLVFLCWWTHDVGSEQMSFEISFYITIFGFEYARCD